MAGRLYHYHDGVMDRFHRAGGRNWQLAEEALEESICRTQCTIRLRLREEVSIVASAGSPIATPHPETFLEVLEE